MATYILIQLRKFILIINLGCLINSVQEEEFEWGNPLNNVPLGNTARDSLLIAKAAHRWRKTIENGGPSKKPFVGMKAVIITASGDESVNSLARVVKSGGGEVLPTR